MKKNNYLFLLILFLNTIIFSSQSETFSNEFESFAGEDLGFEPEKKEKKDFPTEEKEQISAIGEYNDLLREIFDNSDSFKKSITKEDINNLELLISQFSNKINASMSSIIEKIKKDYKSVNITIFDKLKNIKSSLDYLTGIIAKENLNKELKSAFDETKDNFKNLDQTKKIYEQLRDNKKNKNNEKYIKALKYLKNIELISDSDLNNLLNDFDNITDSAKYYICLAMHLYVNLELFIEKLPKKLTIKKEEEKDINIWNLYHVFLGSLGTDDFKGVHSSSIIPNLLTDEKIYTSLKFLDDSNTNNLQNRLIFYKIKNLRSDSKYTKKYYFKVSTIFPEHMDLQKCILSVSNAMNNIKNVTSFKEVVSNIIGYDEENKLFINISYDSNKKSVITFFPLFLNKDDKKEDEVMKYIEELSKKYTALNGTISEDDYKKLYTANKEKDNLNYTDLLKQIESIKNSEVSPSPLMPDSQNMTPDELTTKRKTQTPSNLGYSDQRFSPQLSTSDFQSPKNPPFRKSNKSASFSPSPSASFSPSPSASSEKKSMTKQEALNHVQSTLEEALSDLKEKFKDVFKETDKDQMNKDLPSPTAHSGQSYTQSSTTSKRSQADQQPLMDPQAKMGERTGTQPPSIQNQNNYQESNNTPSRKLYDQNNDDDQQQPTLPSQAAFFGQ